MFLMQGQPFFLKADFSSLDDLPERTTFRFWPTLGFEFPSNGGLLLVSV